MNTVMPASSENAFATRTETKSKNSKQLIQLIILLLLVLLSAFAVVYIKDLSRRLLIEYQNLQEQKNQLYVQWGKLLLEQSTWSTQQRIQTMATQHLGMVMPTSKQVIIIKE